VVKLLVTSLLALFAVQLQADTIDNSVYNEAEVNDAQNKLQTLKAWKMTSELSLDDNQQMSFFQLFNQLEEIRLKNNLARKQYVQDAKDALANKNKTDADYKVLLDRIRKVETEGYQQEKAMIDKISTVLTDKQMVTFYLVEYSFPMEVRRALATERRSLNNQMQGQNSIPAAASEIIK
jgi:hypothetical protein